MTKDVHMMGTALCSNHVMCITRTKKGFNVLSLKDMSNIPTKTLNVFSTDRLSMSLLLFLLHTIHLMLI